MKYIIIICFFLLTACEKPNPCVSLETNYRIVKDVYGVESKEASKARLDVLECLGTRLANAMR